MPFTVEKIQVSSILYNQPARQLPKRDRLADAPFLGFTITTSLPTLARMRVVMSNCPRH